MTEKEKYPLVGSGTYVCEFKDCKVEQTNEDSKDILFYGADHGIYCEKHLNESEYFTNLTDKDILAFANALDYQRNGEATPDMSAKDIVQEFAGDTKVEKVFENADRIVIISHDSGIKVINVVSKENEKDMESLEI